MSVIEKTNARRPGRRPHSESVPESPSARGRESPASLGDMRNILRRMNPWWEGKLGQPAPSMRRWAFSTLLRKMDLGLAPAVLLRGSRQVGKTTLQDQIIGELMSKRGVNPRRILRVQFDELPNIRRFFSSPALGLSFWFQDEILGMTFNEAAHKGEPAFLFFDEVQNLDNWAPELKHLVDFNAVKVVVTGSSALRIRVGQDSLAGRVSVVELDVLHLAEVAALRGDDSLRPILEKNNFDALRKGEFWRELRDWGIQRAKSRDRAFDAFADRGGYPLAHINPDASWGEVAEQLNENIVHRVIRHDLRAGETGGRKRSAPLLEAVFRAACRYCGQSPGVAGGLAESVLRDVKGAAVTPRRVRYYIDFLRDTMLMHLVEPMEFNLQKRRSGAKICLSDHALRAAWLGEKTNLSPRAENPNDAVAGHVAESVAGAFLAALPNSMLNHFPERRGQPEVDFVLTVGDSRIPIEVKYRRNINESRDTAGLLSFIETGREQSPFGVLVTRDDEFQAKDPRIVALPLSSLLLMR